MLLSNIDIQFFTSTVGFETKLYRKGLFSVKIIKKPWKPYVSDMKQWHSRGVKFNTDRKIMSAFPFSTTALIGFAFRLKPLLKIL